MTNRNNNINEITAERQLLLAVLRENKITRAEKRYIAQQFCSERGEFDQVRLILKRLAKSTFRLAEEEIKTTVACGCELICITDQDYPAALRTISDPPLALFVKGHKVWSENDAGLRPVMSLAIVGMRKASAEGCQFARQLAADLVRHGVCMVSGLAYGIDTAAHQGAVIAAGEASEAQSKTVGAGIAVLGSGVLKIYPDRNEELAREIINNGGCIISEYGLDSAPLSYRFPERNRIVSGLVSGVIVVEAAERSGALITARQALEEGRDVFAVPGGAHEENARGTNELIKQGAIVITTTEDIIRHYTRVKFWSKSEQTKVSERGAGAHGLIGQCLQERKALSFDELVEKTGLLPQKLAAELTIMEMQEKIYRHPGNIISLHRFIDN